MPLCRSDAVPRSRFYSSSVTLHNEIARGILIRDIREKFAIKFRNCTDLFTVSFLA